MDQLLTPQKQKRNAITETKQFIGDQYLYDHIKSEYKFDFKDLT